MSETTTIRKDNCGCTGWFGKHILRKKPIYAYPKYVDRATWDEIEVTMMDINMAKAWARCDNGVPALPVDVEYKIEVCPYCGKLYTRERNFTTYPDDPKPKKRKTPVRIKRITKVTMMDRTLRPEDGKEKE